MRISVINVITEVTLTILSKSELTNEQQQSKDEFLEILSDHMLDVSAFVRAKAIQSWNRLQKENLLSTKTQIRILEHIIYHLRDKGSNVRKVAANCVTSFLEHNPFGSEVRIL